MGGGGGGGCWVYIYIDITLLDESKIVPWIIVIAALYHLEYYYFAGFNFVVLCTKIQPIGSCYMVMLMNQLLLSRPDQWLI